MSQPSLERGDYSLSAIGNIKAHENRADVTLHRCLGNSEGNANLLVALACHHQRQNLSLALREGGAWSPRLQCTADRWRKKSSPPVDTPQGAHQYFMRHT